MPPFVMSDPSSSILRGKIRGSEHHLMRLGDRVSDSRAETNVEERNVYICRQDNDG